MTTRDACQTCCTANGSAAASAAVGEYCRGNRASSSLRKRVDYIHWRRAGSILKHEADGVLNGNQGLRLCNRAPRWTIEILGLAAVFAFVCASGIGINARKKPSHIVDSSYASCWVQFTTQN